MQLTLFISSEHPPGDNQEQKFAEHIEQVKIAREVGFDGVAIGNHLSYGSSAWYPPLETLTRLAAETGDMSLATCMLVLPLFHPLHVAQQAALLDIVSGGRFTFGVAPGWQEDEFRILGLDHSRRIGRYVESLTLIKRLWMEERVDFSGKHFEADGLELALKPVQQPRPPMWYGGSVAKAVERAARLSDTSLGDSWVASSHLTEEVITEQAVLYQDTLKQLGKPPPREFPLLRNIVVAPDRETALREAGPFLEASYRIFGQWGLFTNVVGSGKAQLDLEELLAGRVIIGSPEECAEELVRLSRTTGFTRLIARIQWLGMDQRIVLRTIELLAKEVRPLVEKEAGR
ncbi:MAG: LLM class flavin-dependent oxidoreductase [Rhodospirillaceae bacterium]|jgi:alkanesulfonate monooxygenase SsuD/methylene tetrahydromethanopterin reductase-like flavin-dependent oxidoreductase (luciferase family)|nr:LLM class flavin-dependent oxidoreductase [Rhodospirillaceae bacterium]MBT5665202.1 LLM class flavin-dependent oxidoreductase [Rhodospirillaceae bacterium]